MALSRQVPIGGPSVMRSTQAAFVRIRHDDKNDDDDDDGDERFKKQRSPLAMAFQRCIVRYRTLPRHWQLAALSLVPMTCIVSMILLRQNLVRFVRRMYQSSSDGQRSVSRAELAAISADALMDFTAGSVPPIDTSPLPRGQHPRLVLLPSTYATPQTQQHIVQRNGQRTFSTKMLDGYEFQLSQNLTRIVGSIPPPNKRRLVFNYVPLSNFAKIPKLSAISPLERGSCKAVAQWQKGHQPTCNLIHEVMASFHTDELAGPTRYNEDGTEKPHSHHRDHSMSKAERMHWQSMQHDLEQNGSAMFAAAGAFRQVWMIREFDGTKRALKTLRVNADSKKFDLRSFDRHRRDAMSMERLTKSPLIVDIYGHCSNSALFNWGDKGDLTSIYDRVPDISNLELLKIAHNVSLAISDAHNFDEQGRPTIAHTDIKPDQFLYEDGYYKLTDFNRVRFLRWDTYAEKTCGFTVGKNGGIWRSPEEYAYRTETEKVDVYSLGNVLHFLLVGEMPWHGYDKQRVYKLVMKGEHPPVPDEILAKKDSSKYVQTMLGAMRMAFVNDPRKRPSAKEIAEFIQQGVDTMDSSET